MRIAIYIRTSKIDMHPENQRSGLVKYAKLNGFKYKIFEEKESTRKTRPIKQKIIEAVRKKEFDGILVWKLDRWARSVSEASLDLDEFIKKKISFFSLRDNIDITTSTGKFYTQILFAFAELERAIIRERTKAGLERAKKQGKKLGRPKGSKDKKRRRKSGYLMRYQKA